MMKEMCKDAKLDTIYTNHSIRPTTATALHRAGVSAHDICHVTGHRRTESLQTYIQAPSVDRQRASSSILHQYGAAGEKTSEPTPPADIPATTGAVEVSGAPRVSPSKRSVAISQNNSSAFDPKGLFAGASFGNNNNITINWYQA